MLWFPFSVSRICLRFLQPVLRPIGHNVTSQVDTFPTVQIHFSGDPGLNLSVSGAVAEDVPGMVRRIVDMVQAVPGWRHKWKMVSN